MFIGIERLVGFHLLDPGLTIGLNLEEAGPATRPFIGVRLAWELAGDGPGCVDLTAILPSTAWRGRIRESRIHTPLDWPPLMVTDMVDGESQ